MKHSNQDRIRCSHCGRYIHPTVDGLLFAWCRKCKRVVMGVVDSARDPAVGVVSFRPEIIQAGHRLFDVSRSRRPRR